MFVFVAFIVFFKTFLFIPLSLFKITAGCTSVVAIILDRKLIVANAGDSRGVICRSGKALALSEDHKPSQQREIDRITGIFIYFERFFIVSVTMSFLLFLNLSYMSFFTIYMLWCLYLWINIAVGGFITDAGRINGNLNLSRSIGDLKYKQSKGVSRAEQMITAEPDVTTFDINPVNMIIPHLHLSLQHIYVI